MLKRPFASLAIAAWMTFLPEGPSKADPPPSGPAVVLRLLTGDLIENAEAAVGIVEVIVEQKYGRERMLEQRPMSAVKEGDFWRVEGSSNRDRSAGIVGPVVVRIRSADCQVQSLLFKTVLESPGTRK